MNFYSFLFISFTLAIGLSLNTVAYGAESAFSVTPKIIDVKGKQKDRIERVIKLENKAQRNLNVYAFVYNVSPEKGEEQFIESAGADQATSLANWIRITRGVVDLEEEETKEISVEIEMNLRAKPGVYHAKIAFGEGTTRNEAEARIGEDTTTLVNAEVEDDIKEWANLKKFVSEKSVFLASPARFTYTLENSGNTPIEPEGRMFVYNKKGEEIGELKAEKKITIAPGEKAELVYEWEKIKSMGQLKAVIDIAYGKENPQRIRDTIFFWLIPWQTLLIIFGGGVAGVGLLSLLKHSKRSTKRKEQKIVTDIWHPR